MRPRLQGDPKPMAKPEPDKRQEVLGLAIDVFGTRGYRATSIQDLADQVNLSKSTFYHYFESKQHLLVAIYEEVLDESPRALELLADTSRPPDDVVRELLA